MTISSVTLFPRALMPLYIFEPRYRRMLRDVLKGSRVFCLAGQNDREAEQSGAFEPPFPIATVGMVRASHQNDDSTSNLVLQGLTRVRIIEILREEPYRLARIEVVASSPLSLPHQANELAQGLTSLLRRLQNLRKDIPSELVDYLASQQEPEALVDLAAFAFSRSPLQKQALLAELDTARRFQRLTAALETERQSLELEAKLRGPASDEDIARN